VRVLDHPQGGDAWLAARCGLATASCFADVMATLKSGGEASERRNYRARLVVERLTKKPVPTFQNAAMKQGTDREPFARDAYEIHTGNLVDQVGLCLHDEMECGASPDGLIDDGGGLELKCPELAAHLRYLKLEKGCAPAEYFWQVQGCLWITGREWWDFASWNPDFPENLQLTIRRINRDKAAIDKLAAEVARFMDEVRAEVESVSKLAA
jgi:hypothetical protein